MMGMLALIDQERLSAAKGVVMHYVCSSKLILFGKKRISYDKTALKKFISLSDPRYHVFRGYYDIDYLAKQDDYFLCHRLPIRAQNNHSTACEIGYYDLSDGKFYRIAESNAWCWQQGCRLRWINNEIVVFNDVGKTGYYARVVRAKDGLQLQQINWPLYDVTPDFRFGLTLNFSRLQRLRPGYGYNYFPDYTQKENAPEDDGVFVVDINTNSRRMLYTLKELAEKISHGDDYVHYVNHISVGPDGTQFIFFHIYCKPGVKGWNTILYISDLAGEKLEVLEKKDRVSHYCWVDSDNIMVTCHKESGEEYYCIFEISSGEKRIIEIPELCVDGHPCKMNENGLFLTDTYPMENSVQNLRIFSTETGETQVIASFYHDFRLRGEMRCDLHPSLGKSGNFISVDTTYQGKRRGIEIFQLRRGE